jgi:hypothetical protein
MSAWLEKHGAAFTIGVFVIALVLGICFVLYPFPLAVALLFGVAGGIAHEIVQSGGTVLTPKKVGTDGDVNLGTLTGAVLGVLSGFLVLHGVDLTNATASNMVTIAFEALTAGLALKAIADVDPKTPPPPANPPAAAPPAAPPSK